MIAPYSESLIKRTKVYGPEGLAVWIVWPHSCDPQMFDTLVAALMQEQIIRLMHADGLLFTF